MKRKEFTSLKEKDIKELVKLVEEKKLEASQFTARMLAGKEKNLKKGKILRKEIAQIMSFVSSAKEKVEETK